MLWPHVSHVGTSCTSPAITVYSPVHLFLADNVTHLLCQEHGLLQKGNCPLPDCTSSKDEQKIPQQLQLIYGFLTVAWQVMAPQLTVVTSASTRSSIAVSVKDDHATSVVPSETAAHETTAVRASSSHGQFSPPPWQVSSAAYGTNSHATCQS
jgi:hypothetical protein